MHPSSCQSFFDNNTFVNFVPYLRRERFRPHKLQAWFLCRAIGEVHTWLHNGLALKPVDHPLALSTRIHSLYVKAGKSRPFMQVFKLDEVNKLPDHTGHNNFLHSVLHRHTASHSTFFTEGVYVYTWNAFWKFTYCSDTNFVMKMTAIWMHFTIDDQSNRAEEISRSIRACAHGRTHRMHTKRYSWAWCSEANVQRNLSEREWERSDYEGCSIGNP